MGVHHRCSAHGPSYELSCDVSATATTQRRRIGLSLQAQIFLLAIYSVTLGAFALVAARTPPIDQADWRLALLLSMGAAAAQLFVVITPNNQSYHTTPALVVAAALLLPPPLLALVAVLQHIPEWLKERYPWYIQTFNISNYALSALAAQQVFSRTWSTGDELLANSDLLFFLAGVAAGTTFVAVNHFLLALALRFARGHSFRESGLFTPQNLSTDLVIALLGVVVAAVWLENPWLAALALAPLLLVYRTLALPKLEAEARQDPKTELFNARYFSDVLEEALERARRLDQPISLLVADLDLLREINNRYSHLAGDAVLVGIARILREHLRRDDAAARFGGEEFAVVLPNTSEGEAAVIAERIRTAVSEARFDVDTSSEPISATVSIGVASFPAHAATSRELIYRADVAAYRAKAQGRNRVVVASETAELDELAAEGTRPTPTPTASALPPRVVPPVTKAPPPAPNYLSLSTRLRVAVGLVGAVGVVAGLAAALLGGSDDLYGLIVLIALVAVGQALAVEVLDQGTISLTAVGSLAGAAMFGPRVALAIALAVCVVDWSARRGKLHRTVFNVGLIVLSSMAGAAVYALLPGSAWIFVACGAIAGAAYYAVNIGLLTVVIVLETKEGWATTFRQRFGWLFPSYLVYGVVGAMVALAYDVAGVLALFVFAIPLILVRKAQLDYIDHTEESVRRLREASEMIEQQNESLTRANVLLRDRATEAMESLAAAVDARDTYTAGHSRRVQEIAVAIGRELDLDEPELESLSFAALFHDVGKLAVPDALLLKTGPLDEQEWWTVRRHAEEGERIIGHLGFLADATPAIRHHHEHFDGTGYPDGLRGQEIPLGARILHVADAFDSMITTRVYRAARSWEKALEELRQGSGSQFCPSCVAALERQVAKGTLAHVLTGTASPSAA
jgi:diguanylate cyclase (GGDEF)-like protein